MREIQVESMTTFHRVTEQAAPRILWKAAPEGRLGDPYKTKTCQEQGLVLKNAGSVVVEPGKGARDVEEGFHGDFDESSQALNPIQYLGQRLTDGIQGPVYRNDLYLLIKLISYCYE